MFHWKDGWYFGKTVGGDVTIENKSLGISRMLIDPDSWCSIIASVSKTGDTAENFAQAQEFHKGES